MITYGLLFIPLFFVCLLLTLVSLIYIKFIVDKKIKLNSNDNKSELSVSFYLLNSKNYMDYDTYFINKINDAIELKISYMIIVDKMSKTASIEDVEVLQIRDTLYSEILSHIPIPFLNIILTLYTEPQIKLIITESLVNKLNTYYKIYNAKTKNSNKV